MGGENEMSMGAHFGRHFRLYSWHGGNPAYNNANKCKWKFN